MKNYIKRIWALLGVWLEKQYTLGITDLDRMMDEMNDFEVSNFEKMNLSDTERKVLSKVSANYRGAKNNTVIERDGTRKHMTIGNSDTITSLITQSVGDANISVTRTGANINQPLPYLLFGLQGFQSKFASLLPAYIPAGLTVVITVNGAGDLVFTYSDGEVTDVITVSFNGNINYMDFLQSQNQNYFTTKYIKYDISDETFRVAQYKQMINFGLLSALGAKNANQIQPSSRRMSWDFQKDIVNLLIVETKVTADFSFIQNIIPVDGFSITWDIFMATRGNLNNLAGI